MGSADGGRSAWWSRAAGFFAKYLAAPIIVGLVVLAAAERGSEDEREPTKSILLRPYIGDRLSTDYSVVKRTSGECISDVRATQGTDNLEAHRCFSDASDVLDPCWPNASGTTVACPKRPWSDRVTLVVLDKPLPIQPYQQRALPMKAVPFGIELENGERCFFLQGAGQITVSGLRVNFGCSQGDAVGVPDRGRRRWTIPYVRKKGSATEDVEVVRAWF